MTGLLSARPASFNFVRSLSSFDSVKLARLTRLNCPFDPVRFARLIYKLALMTVNLPVRL
ncbi:MAG: hypothetical protein PHR96_03835 [Clostridia bacterium]|nr:hypothetical protein [Clostridia bacterium]